MSDALHVTLVQSRLHWRDPQNNRQHLYELIGGVAERADLLVLPETFTTGFLGEALETNETMDGDTLRWLHALARERDAAVAGSAVIETPEGLRNRFLFVSPEGDLTCYDKRHLFSFAGEDKRYKPGRERVVFDFRGWRICPQICYDLRFPVWCRNRNDYDMLLFVANWPSRRVAAWDALLRARAIENQCYAVAVNRVGEDGRGNLYPGHSAIYDPMGEAVIRPFGEEACREAVLDLGQVRETRESFPFAREADRFEIEL